MKNNILIKMGDDCVLRYLGADMNWHWVYGERTRPPYRFTGAECFTNDCLPENTIDAYYAEKLPKKFAECAGK